MSSNFIFGFNGYFVGKEIFLETILESFSVGNAFMVGSYVQ